MCKLVCVLFSAGQCNEVDICHENAECVFDQLTMSYVCECPDGFSGDGLYCESTVSKYTYVLNHLTNILDIANRHLCCSL